GCFDDGEIGVSLRDELGDVPGITPELECASGTKKRIERAHHVAAQHAVEVVGVFPRAVDVFLVVIAGAHVTPDCAGTAGAPTAGTTRPATRARARCIRAAVGAPARTRPRGRSRVRADNRAVV